MTSWLTECFKGMKSLILQHNIKKPNRFYKPQIIQKECCSIEILDIKEVTNKYILYSYIETDREIIPIDIKIGKPIILCNCNDKLILYFYIFKGNKVEIYLLKLRGCSNWNKNIFNAKEILLFNDEYFMEIGKNNINIECKIKNLKEIKYYHYFVNNKNIKNLDYYFVNFKNKKWKVEKYQCILCLRIFLNLEICISHLKLIHFKYQCIFKEECLFIEKINNLIEFKNDFNFLNFTFLKKKSKFIDLNNFKIKNQNLLINEEYELIDYCNSITKHCDKLLDNFTNLEKFNIASYWNKLKRQNSNIKFCLIKMIEKFKISDEIIELCEILYINGLLNSKEINDILLKNLIYLS